MRKCKFLILLAIGVWFSGHTQAQDHTPIFQTYPGAQLSREQVANLMLAPGKNDIGFVVLNVDGKDLTGSPRIDSLELLPGTHVITVSSYTQRQSMGMTTTYYSNGAITISFTAEAGHFYYLAVVDTQQTAKETLFKLKVVDLTSLKKYQNDKR